MASRNWIKLKQDAETGIETIRAHFEGPAYEPHWHDSYLVGFTEQGVQQFHCRKVLQSSTAGNVFMLEPGEIHDGHAPAPGGFTYSMLYIEPQWMERELHLFFERTPANCKLSFDTTVVDAPELATAIADAFQSLQHYELRIVRQTALDVMLDKLTCHLRWRATRDLDRRLPLVARRTRDYLHAHLDQDVGLDHLSKIGGVDRFRLTRVFKAAFGLAPHAYLIQLRLAKARHMLAYGGAPADVAVALGFADQSHLGRWFRRAYGMTPAHYRKYCTNVPDS